MIVFTLIIISGTKEIYQRNQIQQQIEELQQEAAKINKNNASLQDKIAYLSSPDYQKEEAKNALDLQSPGENVVVVQPSAAEEGVNDSQSQPTRNNVSAAPAAQSSNPAKWWNYFF